MSAAPMSDGGVASTVNPACQAARGRGGRGRPASGGRGAGRGHGRVRPVARSNPESKAAMDSSHCSKLVRSRFSSGSHADGVARRVAGGRSTVTAHGCGAGRSLSAS
jgi:hypothetical protein